MRVHCQLYTSPFPGPRGACGKKGELGSCWQSDEAHSRQHTGPVNSQLCLPVLCLWPRWGLSPELPASQAGRGCEGSFSEEGLNLPLHQGPPLHLHCHTPTGMGVPLSPRGPVCPSTQTRSAWPTSCCGSSQQWAPSPALDLNGAAFGGLSASFGP